MARIDQQGSLPTYSYRSLDGKASLPRKSRLIRNILTLLVVGILFTLFFVRYSKMNSPSMFTRFFPFFRGSGPLKNETPASPPKMQNIPSSRKDSFNPVSKSPENLKTGSPLDAFLSGFVDPAVASQMLNFLAAQAIDPIVFTIVPILERVLPPERIDLILRTTNSISSGELSSLDAIRKNFVSIFESLVLLILNLSPALGGALVDDLVLILDSLSNWMQHTDISVAKYMGQAIAYTILPLFGYGDAALEQAAKIFENGISQLLPDFSSFDFDLLQTKDGLLSLMPPLTKIQPVVMSIFVQMASLRAFQASISSFSDKNEKKEPSKEASSKKKRHIRSHHHRSDPEGDNNDDDDDPSTYFKT